MKIEKIELRHIRLEHAEPFETSFGRFTERHLVILKVFTDIGTTHCEAPSLIGPYYTYETTQTTMHIIRDFIAPALLDRAVDSIEALNDAIAFVRGHNIAKSALDTAWFHLSAAHAGLSLSRFLGGTRDFIEVGISVGIQPDLDTLVRYVERSLKAGYARIKIKIKPGWDIEPVRILRQTFGNIPLMVDANSAYRLSDMGVFQALDPFELLMIEQPLGFDDIYDHSKLQGQIATPICLDESINTVADAQVALELGACRVINIKLSRVGGLMPAKKIHDMCQDSGIPVWCGGMFESAIGQADCIALASLPNFKFPADIAPSKRYFKRDLIKPFITLEGGRVKVPTAAGLGFPIDEDVLEECTVEKEVLVPSCANSRGRGSEIVAEP
ncbi:MAG: o-succinylbenzoate synthase [Acidobacteriota bacterium]|nr:o-succinylbenzoate synthase [Acidobacteriota bacterium]